MDRAPLTPTTRELRDITDLIHKGFGIDLRSGKQGLVAARLGRKLRQGGFASYGAYLSQVLSDPSGESLIDMADALTTNHTSFLREPAHFDFLVRTVLPGISSRVTLQIWSAACSTGEEPYSIACSLLDGTGIGASRFEILATDLSARVLQKAREACYEPDRLRELPPTWKQTFFTRGTGARHCEQGSFLIRPEIVKRINFRCLNLVEPIHVGRKFHAIFCRNVMMYFDCQTQRSLVEKLAACLEPGGYLFVGHSETLSGIEHGLKYVRPAIYRSPCTTSMSTLPPDTTSPTRCSPFGSF